LHCAGSYQFVVARWRTSRQWKTEEIVKHSFLVTLEESQPFNRKDVLSGIDEFPWWIVEQKLVCHMVSEFVEPRNAGDYIIRDFSETLEEVDLARQGKSAFH